MSANYVDVLVVPELDEIAWLLNIRGKGVDETTKNRVTESWLGADVQYNPVAYAYVLLSVTECALYIDEGRSMWSGWCGEYVMLSVQRN